MNIVIKVIISISAFLVLIVGVLSLYLEYRTEEYSSFYQRVDIADKWDLEAGIKKEYVNTQPPKYLIEREVLYLLVQSTDFIYVAHTEPWTNDKLNEQIPEKIKTKYLTNLNEDSWLFDEKKRPTTELD